MGNEPRGRSPRRDKSQGVVSPRSAGYQASIGQVLTDLLAREGSSASKLAEVSGIAPRTIQALLADKVAPTLTVLWRITNAIGVPFGSLLPAQSLTGIAVQRREEQNKFSADRGRFVSRPLFPFDSQRLVEFYEITIAAGHVHEAQAHAAGAVENIVVSAGELRVQVGNEPPQLLHAGDSAAFQADVQHSYGNVGAVTAVIYLVLSYAKLAG